MNNYTNDLIIGLVGQEIAAKVINYNQFSGVTITDEILARINRIKALSCFIGSEKSQLRKQHSFKLLKKTEIKSIELGDDWYTLLKTDGSIEIVRAKNPSREIKNVAITKKTQV